MKQELMHILKRVCDGIEREGNNSLRDMNLTLNQCSVLGYLSVQENQSAYLKTIEKIFQVTQATMQGTVARLEKKNLVTLHGVSNDKRIKIVTLTELGKKTMAEADLLRIENEKKLYSNITSEDKDLLIQLLMKIHDNLY